jgi:hypothetical protein
VIPPRSNEEIEAHRKRRVESDLELKGHTLERVIGDLRGKVSTRSQLAKFSNHHAYISMVEPKKVFEALEDLDWLDADEGMTPRSSIFAYPVPAKEEARSKDTRSPQGPAL